MTTSRFDPLQRRGDEVWIADRAGPDRAPMVLVVVVSPNGVEQQDRQLARVARDQPRHT